MRIRIVNRQKKGKKKKKKATVQGNCDVKQNCI